MGQLLVLLPVPRRNCLSMCTKSQDMGPVHHERWMHQSASCLHRRVYNQCRLGFLDLATAHISNIQLASSEEEEDWNHGNLCGWSLV